MTVWLLFFFSYFNYFIGTYLYWEWCLSKTLSLKIFLEILVAKSRSVVGFATTLVILVPDFLIFITTSIHCNIKSMSSPYYTSNCKLLHWNLKNLSVTDFWGACQQDVWYILAQIIACCTHNSSYWKTRLCVAQSAGRWRSWLGKLSSHSSRKNVKFAETPRLKKHGQESRGLIPTAAIQEHHFGNFEHGSFFPWLVCCTMIGQ